MFYCTSRNSYLMQMDILIHSYPCVAIHVFADLYDVW